MSMTSRSYNPIRGDNLVWDRWLGRAIVKSVQRMVLAATVWSTTGPWAALADARLPPHDANPISAADFIGSIGVNTHLAWNGPWSKFEMIEAELAYLGLTRIRDSVPTAATLDRYVRLASKGGRFDIILTGPSADIAADLENIARLEKLHHGSVAAIEGINEFNVNHAIFRGQDSFQNYPWGLMLDKALAGAVRGYGLLENVIIVASSLAGAGSHEIKLQGNLSPWVDASNWHAYFSHGDQPSHNIRSAVSSAHVTAPGKPVFITETGYYTAVEAKAWGGGGVDENTQAKMILNLLLDGAGAGVAQIYLYELMDNVSQPARDDLENSFGLFHGDGRPKPAATAIRNLVNALRGTVRETKNATAPPLAYELKGLAADDQVLLFARSNEAYVLVLWNETKIWREQQECSVSLATHSITVDVKTRAAFEVIDPLVGPTAVQRTDGGKTIQVALGDHPMMIAITPTKRQTVAP